MRKSWFGRLGVAAAVGWLSVGGTAATGCASQQAPIEQVQVGYVKKTDLMGLDPSNPAQWYFRNAVVDTASSNALH